MFRRLEAEMPQDGTDAPKIASKLATAEVDLRPFFQNPYACGKSCHSALSQVSMHFYVGLPTTRPSVGP